MIKECNVISNNEYITTVLFGNTVVELPSIQKESETIYVEHCENGGYIAVDKMPKEKAPRAKRSVKKRSINVDKKEMSNCEGK